MSGRLSWCSLPPEGAADTFHDRIWNSLPGYHDTINLIERYGHCDLVALVRLIAGAGHREPWETDYSPAATSRVTHVAQCVVFGAARSDGEWLRCLTLYM